MAATLDRSRPFCTIYGLGEPDGAVFVQDGIRFAGDGSEVGREPWALPEVLEIVLEPEPEPVTIVKDETPVKKTRAKKEVAPEVKEENIVTIDLWEDAGHADLL